MRINKVKIIKEYSNFQKRGSVFPIKCKGCKKKCIILYDKHHDEYFSMACGLVILQSKEYQIPYPTIQDFWEIEYAKRNTENEQ